MLEAVTPAGNDLSLTVANITDEEGAQMSDAPVPTRRYFIDCPIPLSPGDILRKRL